jgi:hypothetical protein
MAAGSKAMRPSPARLVSPSINSNNSVPFVVRIDNYA